MLFEFIGSEVASFATKKTLERILDGMKTLITSQNAMNFAKEQLRSRYEEAVRPASYEHIVDNLSLTKNDFIEYFLNCTDSKSLTDHIRSVLKRRSDRWIYNNGSTPISTYMHAKRLSFTSDLIQIMVLI